MLACCFTMWSWWCKERDGFRETRSLLTAIDFVIAIALGDATCQSIITEYFRFARRGH